MAPKMKKTKRAFTIWLTGLPGSGKTTLATLLQKKLARDGRLVEVLDGDVLRAGWCADLDFSKKDRFRNISRAAGFARLLNDSGVIVVVALVSPFRAARAQARKRIRRFFEVYVDCPIEICQARDPKGLYARAARGKLPNLTGVGGYYEAPSRPDSRLKTSRWTKKICLEKILSKLKVKKIL